MNLQRLRDIVAKIKADPSSYYQRVYHSDCGTMHCIAGHAQIQMRGVADDYTGYTWSPYNGSPIYKGKACSTPADAMEWLEISMEESRYLFSADRTLQEIEQVAETGVIPTTINFGTE